MTIPFHVLMYVIAGIGLVLLWRARTEFSGPGADRRMLANSLIGFGVWHIIDSILSHWILGIHRIRMDVDNPLLWDMLWFILFGYCADDYRLDDATERTG